MEKAKAAVFEGAGKPFVIKEFPVVAAPAGMARLSLLASGVCGTDIHIHKGRLAMPSNRIIGHEFIGTVEDISKEDSERSGIRKGDRAIVDIACPCGKCRLCRNGDDANCMNMGVTNGGNPDEAPYLHGGYARKSFAPVENLIKIPDGLDPVMVCVYACVGSTIMHNIALARKAGWEPKADDTAVVQGLGPMGTFAAAYFASLGVKNVVAVTAAHDEQRERAAKEIGVSRVLTLKDDIKGEIMKMTDGLGADFCLEASGAPSAFPTGLDILRNRGVYMVPGQYSVSGGVSVSPEMITFKALHIIGSSQYSISDVKSYLDFLITNPELCRIFRGFAKEYKLEDINTAIADAEAGKNIKTVLV